MALRTALLFAALTGCSTMPANEHPPHVDYDFDTNFVVGHDGKLPFPMTTRQLIVRGIELMPQPHDEQFADTTRWFLYPAGTIVHVRGQLRAYAQSDGTVPALIDLLPGASWQTQSNVP